MKQRKLLSWGLLGLFLVIGFFLRIYRLAELPNGFNWDEAAIGYNAYSLLETGKDEFGKSWPIMMESFGEYKTAVYSWLLVPIVKILGLSVFSVRLPNAIIGSLLILANFWLAKRFFRKLWPAVLVAGLTAISPWGVHVSRFALEWQLGILLLVIGVGCLIDVSRKGKNLPGAVVALSLSLYFYHGLRLLIPLIVLGFIFQNSKILFKKPKKLIYSGLIGLVLLTPLIIYIVKTPNWLARAKAVSIFHDPVYKSEFDKELFTHVSEGWPLVRVMNNKLVYYGKEIVASYLKHFSPEFLFLGVDVTPRLEINKVGKLYLTALPLLLIGLVVLMAKKKTKAEWLLLLWIFLGPMASSLTTDSPHGLRTYLLMPVFQIVTVIGLLFIFDRIKRRDRLIKIGLGVVIGLLFFMELIYFQWQYWLFYRYGSLPDWQVGHQEMVAKVNNYLVDYDQVVITSHYGQPHIFYAFFTPVKPERYQQKIVNQKGGFNSRLSRIGKIEFRLIEDQDYCLDKALIVTEPDHISQKLPRFDQVILKKGPGQTEVMFEMFETDRPEFKRLMCL